MLEPLLTPPKALPQELEELLGRADGLGEADGRASRPPVEGRAATLPVEGRAATLPEEGRAPTLPEEGVARAPADELQPRASRVLAAPLEPKVPAELRRF